MRICIFGAGAVGSHFAVRLADAGHDVSCVIRGPHLAAMKAKGLTLRVGDRETHVKVRASDDPATLGPQDLVISTLKATGVASLAIGLKPLLGADTPVFPACTTMPAPKYTVSNVAGDLYLLRNQMAHGLPFDPKFRTKNGFRCEDDRPVCPEFAHWRYDQVLEECSAFLLCRALQAILG